MNVVRELIKKLGKKHYTVRILREKLGMLRAQKLHEIDAELEIDDLILMAIEQRWLLQDDDGRLYCSF